MGGTFRPWGGLGLIYCTVKHEVVTSYAYGILLSLLSFGAAVWHPSTFTRCVTAVIFFDSGYNRRSKAPKN